MRPQQEQRVERRLAAIFAADVAGYSRPHEPGRGWDATRLAAAREVMDRLIAEHGGRIANTAGDSVLAEFPSAVDAVQCAVAVQERLGEANGDLPEDRRLQFRIGIHLGDVAVRGGDLLGDGVNIAARLEGLAQPGACAFRKLSMGSSEGFAAGLHGPSASSTSKTLTSRCGCMRSRPPLPPSRRAARRSCCRRVTGPPSRSYRSRI